MSTTFSGKNHDPADRVEASAGSESITGLERSAWLKALGEADGWLLALAKSHGASEREAMAAVDEVLKLRRDSK